MPPSEKIKVVNSAEVKGSLVAIQLATLHVKEKCNAAFKLIHAVKYWLLLIVIS
jgi:hypothetical protein